MVREVVEEDVFVVVVLRPHADRDEEATKRNIFFVFLFFFVLCVLFTVDSAFFFFREFFAKSSRLCLFCDRENTRRV